MLILSFLPFFFLNLDILNWLWGIKERPIDLTGLEGNLFRLNDNVDLNHFKTLDKLDYTNHFPYSLKHEQYNSCVFSIARWWFLMTLTEEKQSCYHFALKCRHQTCLLCLRCSSCCRLQSLMHCVHSHNTMANVNRLFHYTL